VSQQAVSALMERVETDQAFRERLESAPTNEAKREVVVDAGYDIEPSDLPAFRSEFGLSELSDEDLEKVAGGSGTLTAESVGSAVSIASAAAAIGAAFLCV
jgi:predicted ribosomally synthesized peptide with nif11-like leader